MSVNFTKLSYIISLHFHFHIYSPLIVYPYTMFFVFNGAFYFCSNKIFHSISKHDSNQYILLFIHSTEK